MPYSIKIATAGRFRALKNPLYAAYNCVHRLSYVALVMVGLAIYANPALTAVRTNYRLYDDAGIYHRTMSESDKRCGHPNSLPEPATQSETQDKPQKICFRSASLRDFGVISVLAPETTEGIGSERAIANPSEKILYDRCRDQFESGLKTIIGQEIDAKSIGRLQEHANTCFKSNDLDKYRIELVNQRVLSGDSHQEIATIIDKYYFEIRSSDDIVVSGGQKTDQPQTLVIRGVTAKARMPRTEEDQRACGNKDIKDFVKEKAELLIKESKRLSPDSLRSLSDDITECYISQGYVNSGVEIYDDSGLRRDPMSGDHENTPSYQLQVIEGTLNTINVRYEWEKDYGDDPEVTLYRIDSPYGLRSGYVREAIRRGNEDVLNTESLHERFEVLLDDPNIRRVEGALRPGMKPGDSVLDVTAVRTKPYDWTFSLDNRISPRIGSFHGTTGLTLRNLNGWGDDLHLEVGAARGLKDFDVRYIAPIPQISNHPFFYGWKADLHAGSNSSGVTEQPFEQINITGRTLDFDIGLRRSFRYDLNDTFQSIFVPEWFEKMRWRGVFEPGITFSHRRSSTKLDGDFFSFTQEADEGRTRITAIRPFAEFAGQNLDGDWVYDGQVRVSHGIPWLGVNSSNVSPPRFSAARGVVRLAYRGPLWDKIANIGNEQNDQDMSGSCSGDMKKVRDPAMCHEISLRLSGQYALNSQPSPEKFSIGGISSVRGFRENTRLYDSGFASSLEYRIPLPRAFMSDIIGVPSWKRSWDEGILTAVTFVDIGWGTDRPHTDSGERGRIFWGAGGGLNYALNSALSANILYGHGFNKPDNYPNGKTIQDKGIYFQITANTDMFGRVAKSVYGGFGELQSAVEGGK